MLSTLAPDRLRLLRNNVGNRVLRKERLAPCKHPVSTRMQNLIERSIKMSGLTRLQDRFEPGQDGDVKIIRYGYWGTNAEIERRKRKFIVVQRGKKDKPFPRLEEAVLYLEELVRNR